MATSGCCFYFYVKAALLEITLVILNNLLFQNVRSQYCGKGGVGNDLAFSQESCPTEYSPFHRFFGINAHKIYSGGRL